MRNPFIDRKPRGPAWAVALAAGAVVLAVLTGSEFLIWPPQGWYGDHYFPVHLHSFFRLFTRDWQVDLKQHHDPVDAVMRSLRLISGQFDLEPAWMLRRWLLLWPLVAAFLAFHYMLNRLDRVSPYVHVNGPRYLKGTEARRELAHAAAGEQEQLPAGVELAPGIPISPRYEGQSFLILGQQASGKTQLFRRLIRQFVERGERVVIHDSKGELTAGLPWDTFILLAPQDRRSMAWDIAADVRSEIAAQEFAAQLVPASRDPMWSDGARNILLGIIVTLQREMGRSWGWTELYERCVQQAAALRKDLLQHYEQAARYVEVGDDDAASRTSLGILITLWAATESLLRPLAQAWGELPSDRRISLTAWVRGQRDNAGRILVLQRSDLLARLSAAWIGCAVDVMARASIDAAVPDQDRDGARLVFALDELPRLQALTSLEPLLAVGRSKGVACILGMQSLSQLRSTYTDETARAILNLVNTKIVGRIPMGPGATEICNDFIGEREVSWEAETISSGAGPRTITRTWQNGMKPILRPQQLGNELGFVDTEQGVRIRALVLGFADIYRIDWAPCVWPKVRPAVEPADWLEE